MQFSEPKAIYLQLADALCDFILQESYKPQTRIPSVRELAAEAGVNPNTMLRAIAHLTDQGILYNQRGVGTFVSANAREIIMEQRKKEFLEEDLLRFFQKIYLLGIDFLDLQSHWQQWRTAQQEGRYENK